MQTLFLMTLSAAAGAATATLWSRHQLLAAFRHDPVRTVRRLCHQAYPPDDLFD